jgi:hypothetical protein
MFRLREKPRKIEPKVEKPTIGDFEKPGFKMDYSRIRKAVMQCELDKDNAKCKQIFKDLNIEIID